MNRLAALGLLVLAAAGCEQRLPARNVLGYAATDDAIFVRVETLTYVRGAMSEGTGARDSRGFIVRVDAASRESEMYGPLYTDEDTLHWPRVMAEGRLLVRSAEGDADAEGPAPCGPHDYIIDAPGGLIIAEADHTCTSEDDWLQAARARADETLGPNAGVRFTVSPGGRFLVAQFDASYYRGDPAQTPWPGGDELGKTYSEFETDGTHHSRAEWGFFFERPSLTPVLYSKRCVATLGQDHDRPVFIDGRAHFACLSDGTLSLRGADGIVRASTATTLGSLRGLLHLPMRHTLYVPVEIADATGMTRLRLAEWDYATNEIDLFEVPLDARARPLRRAKGS